jgi:hypothetical protein
MLSCLFADWFSDLLFSPWDTEGEIRRWSDQLRERHCSLKFWCSGRNWHTLRPLRLHKILAKWQFPCIWSCCLISATDLSDILHLLQRNTPNLRISRCAHGRSSVKWRRFSTVPVKQNRSLQWKIDVEKKNHEVHLHELQLAYSMLSAPYSECFDTQDEVQRLEVEVSRQKEENWVLCTLETTWKDCTKMRLLT